jgi:hypothetical protein
MLVSHNGDLLPDVHVRHPDLQYVCAVYRGLLTVWGPCLNRGMWIVWTTRPALIVAVICWSLLLAAVAAAVAVDVIVVVVVIAVFVGASCVAVICCCGCWQVCCVGASEHGVRVCDDLEVVCSWGRGALVAACGIEYPLFALLSPRCRKFSSL